ncbi:MAG TPA: S-adenosylmethionine:tRNA ribosyltransferase-isomerase, partial [Candidatus Eisenbacteria bacterium]|nr:S-adenosylmethionine:tRNA ribosyltransferase-isomerase [Candidatus Eisenbacteria bacterium]
MTAEPVPRFTLPAGREAATPPEERGLERDQVRMLVVRPDRFEHRRVRDLSQALHPGDLLVVNTSATLAAAVPLVGSRRGETVHLSTQLDDRDWVVEVRRADNTGPGGTGPGDVLRLPGKVALHVRAAHPHGQSRLWRATPVPATEAVGYLAEHGRPIGYRYLAH